MNFLQRFFGVMLPLRDDDPIPISDPNPAPAPTPANGLTCEFCECRLARDGSVMTVGKRGKKFRDQEDTIEGLTRDIADRDATITRLNQEIADLKTKLPKKGSSGY